MSKEFFEERGNWFFLTIFEIKIKKLFRFAILDFQKKVGKTIERFFKI